MKKLLSLGLALIIVLSAFVIPSSAGYDAGEVTKKLHSKVYYMENLDEGTVFFDKDSDKKVPVAGFSKLIAAVVALEKWQNLEGEITVTKENLSVVEYGFGVKTALYKEGEVVSKKELFDCLMVYNANDALSIIAHDVCGTSEAFLEAMQALCTKVGCTSTSIKNLTGFDTDGQYTTASDIAKIVKYAWSYPLFVESFSLKSVTLKATELNAERTYTSTNRMTNAGVGDYYHSSVVAGKHTSTEKAGECIAVVSNKDGYSYLTVVMGGKLMNVDKDEINENTCMTDAKAMLDWVYDNIRYRTVVTPTQTVAVVKVVAGKDADTLRLVPKEEISALLPSNASPESIEFRIVEGTVPEKVTAPVEAGEIIGQAKVFYAHSEVATVDLVAANTIKMSLGRLIMSTVSSILSSKIFVLIVAILALIAIAVFLMNLLDYRRKLDEMRNAGKRRAPQKKPVQKSSGSSGAPAPKGKTPVNKR